MGIKGLTRYIKFGKNISESTNIGDEIKNWQVNHGDRVKPKIVIDLKEFVHSVVQSDDHHHATILGGQFALYTRILRRFFENVTEANADLVFFLTERKVNEDLALYIPKLEKKYIRGLEVLEGIERGCDIRQYVQTKEKVWGDKRVSNALEENIATICPKFGELHATYTHQEIARYVQNHVEVLAVITNDTDFLAFEGEFQFWHANSIHFQNLTVNRFNRQALLENLGVSMPQLQLMGALSGGAYLSSDQSHKFYTEFAQKPKGGRIVFLSWYAKQHRGMPFNLEPIVFDVFGENYTPLDLNVIHNGLKIYDTESASDFDEEYRNDFLTSSSPKERKSFVNFCKKNAVFMYFLMTDKVYKVQDIEYIDYRNFHSKNFAELIVPVLMKMCGILYSNSFPPRLTRRICIKYAHDEPAKVVDEYVIYPEERLPPLFDLIFKSKFQRYMNQRWSLLGWVLDFDEAFIQSISTNASIDKYLPTILSLKFLLQHGEITTHEAYVIMFTEIEKRTNFQTCSKNYRFRYARHPDVRYVRIAHLYVYVYKWINRCLDVCGLHYKTDLIRFDGPQFHANVEEYDSGNTAKAAKMKAVVESIQSF